MKECLRFSTEYVLVALCIWNSLSTILCGQCPSGWQEGPLADHCFNLMSNASTWNESEISCRAEGGHLAALTSIEELQFVDTLCVGKAVGGCWVGGTQQQSSNLLPEWTDCQVQWNVSAFPRAPSPSSICLDPSCPNYRVAGWCTVVVNRSLVWDSCGVNHAHVCGLVQGGRCGQRPSHKEYIVIIIVVSSVILTTTLGVTIWLLAYRTTKRRRRRRMSSLAVAAPVQWRVFSRQELEAFTENFAELNRLGEGEEVNTYKGFLSDGSPIVVKNVRRPGFQGKKDFLAEMWKIGRLKHPNLVSVRGCCFDRGEGYIVYDFISNGSLEKWLHDLPTGARPLDWDKRIRIATGVAHALAFLHDKMKPNLVHRNVRASSVLLDDEFNPHLIGVGLVNMVTSRYTTNEPTVIVGTHGYLAPEFVYRNELTTKSDVFSFGVLLLELITGRKPTGSDGANETTDAPTIFEWATPLVQAEAWTDLLDVLIGTVPNYAQVKKVVDLIYTCTQHVPSMRPRMSYVLFQLQELHTAELMVVPVDPIDTPGSSLNRRPVELQTEYPLDDASDVEIREIPL